MLEAILLQLLLGMEHAAGQPNEKKEDSHYILERERERERESVCVCVCEGGGRKKKGKNRYRRVHDKTYKYNDSLTNKRRLIEELLLEDLAP